MKIKKNNQKLSDYNPNEAKIFVWLSIAGVILASILFSFVIYYSVGTWFGARMISACSLPLAIALLFSKISFFHGLLRKKAIEEAIERENLELRKARTSAFDADDETLFANYNILKKFTNLSPYIVSVVAFLILLGTIYYLGLYYKNGEELLSVNPFQAAFVTVLLALPALFFGVFLIGQSRSINFRSLRPVGVWFFIASVTLFVAAFAVLMKQYQLPLWDFYLNKFFLIFYLILAFELLINFVIEFYRPRTGGEGRPVFESRILSFFTEPGGVLRNIANTLDYQFGFKVSGTWVYVFLERSIIPLLFFWMLLLWVFTGIDEVAPGEMGVRETFGIHGKTLLKSGVYLKWPWPIQIIRKIPVNKIRQIFIGPQLKDNNGKEMRPDIVLWTQSHYAREGRFLIATDLYDDLKTDNKDTKEMTKDVPVSMIAALLPIQYKIKPEKVFEYAYAHANPVEIFKNVSEKIITNYFASADMLKLMSNEREKAIKIIEKKLQIAIDNMDLGIQIVAVTFLDAHPPIDGQKLPEAFQEVVAAGEEKETEIHKAEEYKAMVIPKAQSDALRIKLEAEAYRYEKTKISKAEIERFRKRLPGYRAMPEMYILNSMMKFWENDCRDIRKYILPADTKHDVYIINLEEKQKLDLLDINDLN
jgi:regulator of protease activity HflC (stomatin/prohibitin superfamily)